MKAARGALTALSLASASVAAAQAPADSVPCEGQRIDSIAVEALPANPGIVGRLPVLRDVMRKIQVPTRQQVVRRYLQLAVGDLCSEVRRAESERILRGQPFISEATLTARRSPQGDGIVLDVRTVDEIPTLFEGRFRMGLNPFRSVNVGDYNIDGRGIYGEVGWRDGGVFRDGFSARFTHRQFLSRPYVFALAADRLPLGESWRADAIYPFYTDLQRASWRIRAGSLMEYVGYADPSGAEGDHALRLDRHYWEAGASMRIGPPGRLSLFGASVSSDDETPASVPVLITSEGLRADTDPTLRNRYAPHRMARLNVVWGVRDIRYVRVRGFDALTAIQDIGRGFQLGTIFGRSLSVLGSRDDDIFVAADAYAGVVGPRAALRIQMRGEGRRANDTELWDGLLTSGSVIQNIHLGPRQMFIGRLEWSGGARQRIPFGLTLGHDEGGIRGLSSSREVGALRIVGRLENRFSLGRFFNLADAGLALFADAGQLWAGSVPFGVSTPLRGSVGIGVLAAIPPQSRRLWRIDFALAQRVTGPGLRFEMRFSSRDHTRAGIFEPWDVARARELTVPVSAFR